MDLVIKMEEYGDDEQTISHMYDFPMDEFLKAQDEYFRAKGE